MSDALNSRGRVFAAQLFEYSQHIGRDRGVELSLELLYLRWRSIDSPDLWLSIENAPDPFARAGSISKALSKQIDVRGTIDLASEYADFANGLVNLISNFFVNQVAKNQIVDVFETLCTLAFEGQLGGHEFQTPKNLADLLVSLVAGGKSFYDPACGIGSAFSAAAQLGGIEQLAGCEINPVVAEIAEMRIEMLGFQPIISSGDAFAISNGNRKFDSVVIQPPWGVQIHSEEADSFLEDAAIKGDFRNTPGIRELSWLFLARESLNQNGIAAVLVPLALVASRKSRVSAWKSLIESQAIEAVISLPPGIVPHTHIALAIVLLRPAGHDPSDSLLFIDAESFVESLARNKYQFSSVGIDEISKIVEEFRTTRTVSLQGYVAKAVLLGDIDLEKGLLPSVYLDSRPQEIITHPEPLELMITNLSLTNFKAYGNEAQIPTAPITLIFGANSAGKSSSIQALRLLKQSIKHDSLVTQGEELDVGGFQGIQHRHNNVPISVGVRFGSPGSWIPSSGTLDPSFERRIGFTFDRDEKGHSHLQELHVGYLERIFRFVPDATEHVRGFKLTPLQLEELLLDASGGMLYIPSEKRSVLEHNDATKKQSSRESQARRAAKQLSKENETSLLFLRQGLVLNGDIESDLSRLAFAGSHGASVQESFTKRSAKLVAGIATEFDQLLSKIVYLGPLRSAPKRMYSRTQENAAPGEGYESAIFLYDNSNVATEVNNWLQELEIPYELAVVPISSGAIANLVGDLVAVVLTDKRSGVLVSPADVGFGISQVLPIVVELLSRRESIICIEQPETHLHPRLQGNLADLFVASTSKEGSANQVIIETHSEHMVLRLQRRIREGVISPEHVSIVYVDQNSDGETSVLRLRLNDRGDFIDEWPHGFFDERLDDLFGDLT